MIGKMGGRGDQNFLVPVPYSLISTINFNFIRLLNKLASKDLNTKPLEANTPKLSLIIS